MGAQHEDGQTGYIQLLGAYASQTCCAVSAKIKLNLLLRGVSFFAFMIEAVTGTLLLFYYEPGEKAFASIGP